MHQPKVRPKQSHFHIFWVSAKRFDWQAFRSYDDAVQNALNLAQASEPFEIREFGTQCNVCIATARYVRHRAAERRIG